ncbi:MAG: response regulator transcription factor [Acidimicrobiales bacterium]
MTISDFVQATKWSESMVSVLVCDESAIERRRLMVALETSPDIEVVAEADDAELVLAQVQEAVPDVVWLDLRLTGVGAVRLASSIHEVLPTARVVIIAGVDDHEARRRAIKAGAVGVVDREQVAARAAEVTRRVAWGRCEVSPPDIDRLLATYAAFAREAGSVQQQVVPPALDARQQRVLELLAADRPPAEVAAEVGLSEASVGNLVGDAIAALHRHTRAEAVTYAVGARLFDDGAG